MDVANIAILGGVAGAGVSGLFNLLSLWFTRRGDDRRHYRDLVIQLALEQWRQSQQRTVELNQEIKTLPNVLPGLRVPTIESPELGNTILEMDRLLVSIFKKH